MKNGRKSKKKQERDSRIGKKEIDDGRVLPWWLDWIWVLPGDRFFLLFFPFSLFWLHHWQQPWTIPLVTFSFGPFISLVSLWDLMYTSPGTACPSLSRTCRWHTRGSSSRLSLCVTQVTKFGQQRIREPRPLMHKTMVMDHITRLASSSFLVDVYWSL
jgi:hypothetical protein